jgi:hypothetical protein
MEKMITIPLLEYEGLKKTVQQLQEEFSLFMQSCNSSTSSTSPSHDLSRSDSHSLRKSSGKKSVGQSGREGHHLSMNTTQDTDTVTEKNSNLGYVELHVWQTQALTFMVSFAGRGHKVIEKYYTECKLHSFYVSDCWASQLKVPAKRHQLCIAHLLRELLNFEKSLHSQWSVHLKNLLYRALELKEILIDDDYKNTSTKVLEIEGKGADWFAGIRSIIDTAIKNGLDVFGTIQRLAKYRNTRVVTPNETKL